MPNLEMLRVFVNERLTVAAEEIFGLFARTVAEYEDQLSRWKQENERQIKLLDTVLNPDVRLNRIGVQLDVEPPNSKNEQDPLLSSQEGEQLELIPEKSVDEDKKAQSSLLEGDRGREPSVTSLGQQREIKKENEEDGGPQPGSNLDLETFLQPANDTKAIDNNDFDCNQHTEPEAQLIAQENPGVSEVNYKCNADSEFRSCSECGKTHEMQSYVKNPLGELVCSVCVERPTKSLPSIIQKRTYSGTRVYTCSFCKRQFSTKSDTARHIRTHTGEKPFGCVVCGQRFSQSTGLGTHMRIHTGERPFSCLICQKHFMRSGILARHMRVHTGEKPYSCSVCNTSFTLSQSLSKHMRIHTGEKPFSCTVCGKKFTQKGHLTQHMPLHTGERLFSCHVCGKKFSRQSRVKKHKCVTDTYGSI